MNLQRLTLLLIQLEVQQYCRNNSPENGRMHTHLVTRKQSKQFCRGGKTWHYNGKMCCSSIRLQYAPAVVNIECENSGLHSLVSWENGHSFFP